MIGIKEIGCYIPHSRVSNYDRTEEFQIDNAFIEHKIGVKSKSIKGSKEDTSDLCVSAYKNLIDKIVINQEKIDVCIVVTQNPDYGIPHTSAIVHEKLGLKNECACFDVSLGCSGYVYGLSILKSFMETNGFENGLLFTADPYSKIVDNNDKNTALLFGDAATVTLLSNESQVYTIGSFLFGTSGNSYDDLIVRKGKLEMNGRAIFNFCAKAVPESIKKLLEKTATPIDTVDCFLLHQGSKYIVDTITKRLGVPAEKVPFEIYEYGNTISSSIPLILAEKIKNPRNRTIVLCGFGVGLSWASSIINKTGVQDESNN